MNNYYQDFLINALNSYCFDEEEKAEILFWLKNNLKCDTVIIEKWLDEHDYCNTCGNKLEYSNYKEYHNEVSCSENMTKCYCPFCCVEK